LLSYYVAANGKRERDYQIIDDKQLPLPTNVKKRVFKLSKQLWKGLRDAFHKFDEYQFSKYNAAGKDISLKDVLFMVCPKPRSDHEADLFKKIANDALKTADTWEAASSEMGQEVALMANAAGLTEEVKEELKKQKMCKMWEKKIEAKGAGQMGYMALMRNLMNFLKYDVSIDHIKLVAARLADPKEVAASKQFPFRFVTAYRMISENCGVTAPLICWGGGREHPYANKKAIVQLDSLIYKGMMAKVTNPKGAILMEALEDAIKHACKNIPAFGWDEAVLIAADVSGSMQHPVSEKKDERGRVVAESKLLCYDVGLALAMMLQYKCKVVSAGLFGDSFLVAPFPKDQILRNVDEMRELEGVVGYSTNGYLVIDYAIEAAKKGIVFDKVFMFSDNQLWNNANDLKHIDTEWKKFKTINPKAKLYIFDLAGYGTSPVNLKQGDVYMVAGWSDKIFDMLEAIENGGNAIKKIESIKL